jgi:DNA-binding beta-propeller fold protein YncE
LIVEARGLRAALPTAVRRAGARWGGLGAAGAGGRGAVVRRGARGPATVALAAALVAGAGVACAPAVGSPAGGAPTLYVASSVDGTVAQLDAGTGRPLGPPLPAGPLPWQLARGPDGSLLALSASPNAAWPLTHLRRAGEGWAARPVALPGPTREPRLAGGGGRYAVVVDRASGAPTTSATDPGTRPTGCRLTLVDAPTGTVAAVATAAACGPHDQLTGLALGDGPGGPVAYLALWHPAAPGDAGRIVAVSARTGATLAVFRTGGAPVLVALGAAPGRLGHRLYAVERLAGPEDEPPRPPRARLLGLHTATLELESARLLDFLPVRLAVAPDGDAAYALHDHALTRVDLAGGGAGGDRRLARLPAQGLALAVAGDRVYVTSAYGRDVWAFRRRDGRLVATLPVGAVPADLLLGPAE